MILPSKVEIETNKFRKTVVFNVKTDLGLRTANHKSFLAFLSSRRVVSSVLTIEDTISYKLFLIKE